MKRIIRTHHTRTPGLQLFSLAAVALIGVAALVGCDPKPASRIGTFTPRVVDTTTTYSPEDIATEAKAVGAKYARIQQEVGKPLVREVAAVEAKGIQAHLVVKSPDFGKVPSDLNAYKHDLAKLLDERPTPLLAVQNEETVDRFWTDTSDNYLRLLSAATSVAKDKGIPVTNGGIDRPVIALATWNHLRLTRGTAYADKFLNVVFDTAVRIKSALTGVSPSDPDPYRRIDSAVSARWKEGEYLLSHYGTDPGDVPIDYVNFHWYVSDQTPEGFRSTGDYTDVQALRDVVSSIRDMTGKQAVTNEIGQWGTTPEAVTGFITLLRDELTMPWVFWFDADGLPARALHENGEPGVLRENGKTFARLMATS